MSTLLNAGKYSATPLTSDWIQGGYLTARNRREGWKRSRRVPCRRGGKGERGDTKVAYTFFSNLVKIKFSNSTHCDMLMLFGVYQHVVG